MTPRIRQPLADRPNATHVLDTIGCRIEISASDANAWRPLIRLLQQIADRQD
jgi:hypothetical protein